SEAEYQWTGKLNLLVTPDHTLEVAYYGSPHATDSFREVGAPGLPSRVLTGSQDLVGHWISKLFDKKWQVEATMSYHREIREHDAVDDPLERQTTVTWNTDPALNTNKVPDRQGSAASISWFKGFEPFCVTRDAMGQCIDAAQIIDEDCDVASINMPAPPP